MNGDQAMAAALCASIRDGIDPAGATEVVLCPAHILIPTAVGALAGSPVSVGAQDLDANPSGAFTGQVSAGMIVDSGCRYVIVGHSERRARYHETDELVAQKTQAALAAGLNAIVCLGETEAQRHAGETEQVVARQLRAVLDLLGDGRDGQPGDSPGDDEGDGSRATNLSGVVIAYEPVWAIGTGATATPAQAQQVHRFIRERLAAWDARVAAQCRILYGGSMKPQNAAELIAQADIDGGLIGGAALNAADFLAICTAAGSA